MRKALLIFLTILSSFSLIAWKIGGMDSPTKIGGMTGVSKVGGMSVSSSCSSTQQAEDGTSTGSQSVGVYSTSKFRSAKFTYSGTSGKPICKINLWLSFDDTGGTTPRNYYALLYANSGNLPTGSAIGTSDSVNVSGIGGSEIKVSFTLSTPSSALTNGTVYHVAFGTDTNDSDDYAEWHREATQAYTSFSDGSSWTTNGEGNTFKFELVSQ